MLNAYYDAERGGTLYTMPFPMQNQRPCYVITGLGVQRAYRGQGVATYLMKDCIFDADKEQVDLVLSVQPDPDTNESRLRAFYARFGFRDFLLMGPEGMLRHPQWPPDGPGTWVWLGERSIPS